MIPGKKQGFAWLWVVILFVLELIRRGMAKEDIFEELGKRHGMTRNQVKDFWENFF